MDAALIAAAEAVLPLSVAKDGTSAALPQQGDISHAGGRHSDLQLAAVAAAATDSGDGDDVRHSRRFDRWAARRAMLGAPDDDDEL